MCESVQQKLGHTKSYMVYEPLPLNRPLGRNLNFGEVTLVIWSTVYGKQLKITT